MHNRWKPNVTVAAVIERNARFLLVEEHTAQGLRLNNPAGHLDPGESLLEACIRETQEETAFLFRPQALVGVYLARTGPSAMEAGAPDPVTYLRFAFCGELGEFLTHQALDHGIARTLWLSVDEVRASTARHRTPVLLQCVEDYLAGARYPLELLHTRLA